MANKMYNTIRVFTHLFAQSHPWVVAMAQNRNQCVHIVGVIRKSVKGAYTRRNHVLGEKWAFLWGEGVYTWSSTCVRER